MAFGGDCWSTKEVVLGYLKKRYADIPDQDKPFDASANERILPAELSHLYIAKPVIRKLKFTVTATQKLYRPMLKKAYDTWKDEMKKIVNLDTPHRAAQLTYNHLLRHMFIDDGEMSWEKVLMCLVVTTELMDRLLEIANADTRYLKITAWCVDFISQRMEDFIANNGGWENFVTLDAEKGKIFEGAKPDFYAGKVNQLDAIHQLGEELKSIGASDIKDRKAMHDRGRRCVTNATVGLPVPPRSIEQELALLHNLGAEYSSIDDSHLVSLSEDKYIYRSEQAPDPSLIQQPTLILRPPLPPPRSSTAVPLGTIPPPQPAGTFAASPATNVAAASLTVELDQQAEDIRQNSAIFFPPPGQSGAVATPSTSSMDQSSCDNSTEQDDSTADVTQSMDQLQLQPNVAQREWQQQCDVYKNLLGAIKAEEDKPSTSKSHHKLAALLSDLKKLLKKMIQEIQLMPHQTPGLLQTLQQQLEQLE